MGIASLLWKTIPKPHRKILLEKIDAANQYPVHKLLSNDIKLPKDFIDLNCIFIHVPKCAGTSVKNALFDHKTHGHMPLWFYEKLHPEFYQQAYKFTFVRHPLDRAYSAFCYIYNNELERNASIKEVVRHYGDFDIFVQKWLSLENARKHVIFSPQIDFLTNAMGVINMDFIGRQENLSEDIQTVLNKLNLSRVVEHRNASVRESAPNFDKRTIDKIYTIYADDFELLGYK